MDTFSLPILLLIFIASLTALMKGADYMIEGASKIAQRLGVSQLVIGLTVIALGTSLPELVVSIQAAVNGKGSLALANVIGSNSTNILLVIGMTALLRPLTAPSSLKKDEVPFSLALNVAFFVMVCVTADLYFGPGYMQSSSLIERWGGWVLLGFFAAFVGRLLKSGQKEEKEEVDEEAAAAGGSPLKAWLEVIVGCALVVGGGRFTVESAIGIARIMELSETTIGITIVAFGTSLPELVASVVAARKGFSDMAIGNVMGSNIMNLALVLGTAGAIAPIHVGAYEIIDIVFMTVVSLGFLGLIGRTKKPTISRQTGAFFVVTYVLYMAYVAFR